MVLVPPLFQTQNPPRSYTDSVHHQKLYKTTGWVTMWTISLSFQEYWKAQGDFKENPEVRNNPENLHVHVFVMHVARHTRPEGHFKVWATIIFFQRPLPPTPRAETGLPLLQSIRKEIYLGKKSPCFNGRRIQLGWVKFGYEGSYSISASHLSFRMLPRHGQPLKQLEKQG